jgi:hypothetical protein
MHTEARELGEGTLESKLAGALLDASGVSEQLEVCFRTRGHRKRQRSSPTLFATVLLD